MTCRRTLTALVAVGLAVLSLVGLTALAHLRDQQPPAPEPVAVQGHGCVRCDWWRAPDSNHLWRLHHGDTSDRPANAHPAVGPYRFGDQEHEDGGGSRRLVPLWLIVVLGAWVLFRLVAPVVSGEKGRHG